jgi:histone chaperone ASF1
MVEDQEMAGAETSAAAEGEVSGDESEDLEGESSGSEEEDVEEEEEGDADEAMEVDDAEKPTNGVAAHQIDEVMAH